MFFLFSILWFIRETKAILFWLYLWQLKEYRIDRFLDHFRTEKGKRLLINKLVFFKIVLIFIFFVLGILAFYEVLYQFNFPSIFFSLIFLPPFLYFLEAIKGLKDSFQKKLKVPILTKKTFFLIIVGIIIEIFFIFANNQAANYIYDITHGDLLCGDFSVFIGFFVFDVFTPIIVSAIVFLFQPFTVFFRNQ
ncbi:MAG: hypothetical protein QME61_04090, partial [Patescibacteria group bacterium]|nr:hypothetical protein [Patescibacteria group bacterium]